MTMTELDRVGLLHAEPTARISRFALFVPADHLGVLRPVVVAGGAVICAFATVHGGVALAENALVEEQAVIGKPEHGYAVGRIHPGAGGMTLLGAESVIRSGAIVYADVEVAAATVVGHQSVLRTGVRVGAETVLGHHLCVERGTWIGQRVRCSPGSHITSSTHLADEVFLGAGVRTVNDKTLTWRDPNREPILVPPRFETGAKVGTGSVIMGGVTIGARALVGAGSLVTRDIPPGALAYGHPARVHGKVNR
ncbi:hypothetical protein [Nocardia harenae]|uniref:hypothetical protein n=1 Tax=Nocardia harenae TaxID=358707 RepID=UPI0024810B41|nr:hypothetical protein [Nocardia harenae]